MSAFEYTINILYRIALYHIQICWFTLLCLL